MDHRNLTCEDCGLVLIQCDCETGRPVAGDLVTRDLVEFTEHGGGPHPAVTVIPGDPWRVVVLTWMYLRGIYRNVWWIGDDDVFQPLGLDMADEEEPHG